MLDLKPWMLPLIVAAVVLPVTLGFMVAGPPLGLAVGALAGGVLIVIASRNPPRGTIETVAPTDSRRHVLIVLTHELDAPEAIERIVDEASLEEDGDAPEILMLAPSQPKLLDRWATDVGAARAEAQRKLVVSAATLGKAHVRTEAAVGDEGVVQAIEDRLRTFPAAEVVLVTGPPDEDPHGERAAAELAERLAQPLLRVVNA
jgi:hypothetical protein